MTDSEEMKLKQRGRMAYLKDDIGRLSRERDNLLRPLRQRVLDALPLDAPQGEAANPFDVQAATHELASVADVNERLDAAIEEYNALAKGLTLPEIKRFKYYGR